VLPLSDLKTTVIEHGTGGVVIWTLKTDLPRLFGGAFLCRNAAGRAAVGRIISSDDD
jgi:hypothetical protein